MQGIDRRLIQNFEWPLFTMAVLVAGIGIVNLISASPEQTASGLPDTALRQLVWLGIGIVPYQSIAREVRLGQFFCARIEGQELIRETGWVYARSNRVPRMISELLTAFDAIRGKLQAAPRRAGKRT